MTEEQNKISQAVRTELDRTITEANKSEALVAQQIILIDSGLVAVVAALTISASRAELRTLSALPRVLIIGVVLALSVSLVAGIIHLLVDRQFWQNISAVKTKQLESVDDSSNADSARSVAVALEKVIPRSSNRVAFWLEVAFFLAAMTLIVILAMSRLLII